MKHPICIACEHYRPCCSCGKGTCTQLNKTTEDGWYCLVLQVFKTEKQEYMGLEEYVGKVTLDSDVPEGCVLVRMFKEREEMLPWMRKRYEREPTRQMVKNPIWQAEKP